MIFKTIGIVLIAVVILNLAFQLIGSTFRPDPYRNDYTQSSNNYGGQMEAKQLSMRNIAPMIAMIKAYKYFCTLSNMKQAKNKGIRKRAKFLLLFILYARISASTVKKITKTSLKTLIEKKICDGRNAKRRNENLATSLVKKCFAKKYTIKAVRTLINTLSNLADTAE